MKLIYGPEFTVLGGHALLMVWLRQHHINPQQVHQLEVGRLLGRVTLYRSDLLGHRYLDPATEHAAVHPPRRFLIRHRLPLDDLHRRLITRHAEREVRLWADMERISDPNTWPDYWEPI